ncbi:siderophore-interacting protein [Dyella jejuensis]|uniref:Siderophore-interacting protein n=1 Tax=Dyella jejuensis TaxID=1432009 RepID=A0ABW8JEK5_9GAMM
MTEHIHHTLRHATKLRTIDVHSTKRMTPHMQRIVFTGTELHGFFSAAPDDHVKLFFPNADGELVLPTLGPNGPEFAAGLSPSPARDYTPRDYDRQRNALTIDFVIHGDGPASTWAERAQPGQRIGLGGPRGSFMPARDFDHYVLIGDETALPAIGRQLDEWPAGMNVYVIVEIAEKADRLPLGSQADFHVTWLERDGTPAGQSTLLEQALRQWPFPPGDTFYWIAAESHRTRAMRKYLSDERHIPSDWIRAKGYWKSADAQDRDD